MKRLAPIVVFASRRPKHLAKLISSLQANPESKLSDLVIYVGGPLNPSHTSAFEETIRVADQVSQFANVTVRVREEIRSGGSLIRFGIDEILETSERLIVLEDDLVVHPAFLKYMNLALERYSNSEIVSQISGWNFSRISGESASQTYLFPATTPWGWATWKRAWKSQGKVELEDDFSWLTSHWLRVHKFNFNENYNTISIVEKIIDSGCDYYDAEWYLHCFRYSNLTLFPNISLVINNGFDGSGLNFTRQLDWPQEFSKEQLIDFKFPQDEVRSHKYPEYIKGLTKWYRKTREIDFFTFQRQRVKRKIHQHRRYAKKGYYSLFSD
jgi:hypothetical protein